jgi:potassium efflux system protein
VVTNFHLPEKRLAVQVQVPVGYDADADRVERVLGEVARAGALEIPGMLAEPAPTVTLEPGFGESGMAFTINCQVAEFAQQYAVRTELRKRVLRRLREEGIPLAYPARTVYIQNQKI